MMQYLVWYVSSYSLERVFGLFILLNIWLTMMKRPNIGTTINVIGEIGAHLIGHVAFVKRAITMRMVIGS